MKDLVKNKIRYYCNSKIICFCIVIICLFVFGVIKNKYERKVQSDLISSNVLLFYSSNKELKNLSQSAIISVLGGFRSLISSYLALKAFNNFSNKEWDELKQVYKIIVTIEPRDENHWRNIIWHLGINAIADMENDPIFNKDKKLSNFEKNEKISNFILNSISLGEKGLEYNPKSIVIREQLAEVYKEKLKNFCKASKIYKELSEFPNTLPYVKRFYGYYTAKCKGKEKEAYDYLIHLYNKDKAHHKPTLIKEIERLKSLLK